jgi:hypothetical protein
MTAWSKIILISKLIIVYYLFIYRLFYDAFSVTASNERVINKLWIGKDLERSNRSLTLRNYTGIRLEGLRKNNEKASARIPGLRAEFWTWDLRNMKQQF